MSNFLKKGKRDAVRKKNKEIKYRTKEFYKILRELDEVAHTIVKDKIEVSEDNIVNIASKYTTRKIENLEKLVLLGKIQEYGGKILIPEKEEKSEN